MNNVINNDETLKYFCYDAEINLFDEHQVNLRIASLKIALAKSIDNFAKTYKFKYK